MDAKALREKMLAAREQWVEAGGYKFLVRRPTELELVQLRNGQDGIQVGLELVQRYVVDWKGVSESDVIPGGASDPQDFYPEVWQQWIADRPDLWGVIAQAIYDAISAYAARLESVRKN